MLYEFDNIIRRSETSVMLLFEVMNPRTPARECDNGSTHQFSDISRLNKGNREIMEPEIQRSQHPTGIIFFDGNSAKNDGRIDQLIDSRPNCTFESFEMRDNYSGVEKISQTLSSSNATYESVHIFAQSVTGGMKLGGDFVDRNTLWKYVNPIATWSDSLAKDAKIVIHGFELGQSEEGCQLIQALQALTERELLIADSETMVQASHSLSVSDISEQPQIDMFVEELSEKPAIYSQDKKHGITIGIDHELQAVNGSESISELEFRSVRSAFEKYSTKAQSNRFDRSLEINVVQPHVELIVDVKGSTKLNSSSSECQVNNIYYDFEAGQALRKDASHGFHSLISRIQQTHFKIIQANSALGLVAAEVFLF